MQSLDERTRLVLFKGTPFPVAAALSVDLSGVGAQRLREMGVHADNLRAAAIGPVLLREAGVCTASELRALGLDAIDLRDAGFASQAIACFGSKNTTDAFVCGPSDAVNIVGSTGCELLAIKPEFLLERAAGEPEAARAVISELKPNALAEVTLDTLLSTGIQIQQLSTVGYTLHAVVSLFNPTPDQLRVMGVRVQL